MAHELFIKLLRKIYATGESELDCERVRASLPAYVEFELAGNDPAGRFPQVKAHLAQCPDCAEEHEGLRAVASLEAKGALPEAEESLKRFEAEPVQESADIGAVPAP
ncbi:MAG: zf-HC2 domain-containing protein [Chloroflexi bacterium]|nr:zf-HC2 domain-containing protein [Chloroflexota bacterium]